MRPVSDNRRGIGEVLAEFAGVMADQQGSTAILERLGDYCTELLPVHGVGLLLRSPDGGMAIATANTDLGQTVEALEVELAEGPCTDCLRTGEQVLCPDLEQFADRYPRFVPRALDAGVRSVHALPMTARVEQLGSVDVIATEPLHLDAEQLSTAQLLVDVAVSYVVNSRAFEAKDRLAGQLQTALDSRVVIEQAKGVLAERGGVTVSEAFETLRRHARNNGLKLHDVAQAVVRGDLRL